MMNNGAMNPQMAAAAAAARQLDGHHRTLNTYIYEYFIRYGMYDCARSLLSSDQQVNVYKDGTKGGNAANGDDPMDTDSKDDLDAKLPDDLPPPKLPIPASDTSFLYEWFCLFWEIYDAQRVKTGSGPVNQYVAHTQVRQTLFLTSILDDHTAISTPSIYSSYYWSPLVSFSVLLSLPFSSEDLIATHH